MGARFFVEWCVSFQRRKRARKEQEVDKLGSRVIRSTGERTGDGRVRSESWHVFWIGSERLSEMEQYLHIGMGRVQ